MPPHTQETLPVFSTPDLKHLPHLQGQQLPLPNPDRTSICDIDTNRPHDHANARSNCFAAVKMANNCLPPVLIILLWLCPHAFHFIELQMTDDMNCLLRQRHSSDRPSDLANLKPSIRIVSVLNLMNGFGMQSFDVCLFFCWIVYFTRWDSSKHLKQLFSTVFFFFSSPGANGKGPSCRQNNALAAFTDTVWGGSQGGSVKRDPPSLYSDWIGFACLQHLLCSAGRGTGATLM